MLGFSHGRVAAAANGLVAVVLAGCAGAPPGAPTPPAAAVSATPPVAAAAVAAASAAVDAPPSAAPAEDAALQARFAEWLAGLRTAALAAGVTEATLQSALADVRYLPRVVELDRAQPEFTRPVWQYLDVAVSAQRVAQGRLKLNEVRAQADAASARHGVPPEVLVAIWGVESNYGSNYGNTPTIDALATLGFDGRREAWARGQLIAALKILQNGDIDRAQMVGSWAGAMGQTQFLPSVFLAHAQDADGDGRRDIWHSMADVLASTAHFLAQARWQPGQPWGTEVQLPPDFDLGRADGELRQPSAQWAAEGVRAMDGTELPAFADGALLLPAGARGPAFLVGPNFRAILRYNNASSYALAVSLLAQQIAGGPGVQAHWPRDLVPLGRAQVTALQAALNERGFPAGAADGVAGPATRAALRRYQRSVGLPADGFPTLELLQRLQAP